MASGGREPFCRWAFHLQSDTNYPLRMARIISEDSTGNHLTTKESWAQVLIRDEDITPFVAEGRKWWEIGISQRYNTLQSKTRRTSYKVITNASLRLTRRTLKMYPMQQVGNALILLKTTANHVRPVADTTWYRPQRGCAIYISGRIVRRLDTLVHFRHQLLRLVYQNQLFQQCLTCCILQNGRTCLMCRWKMNEATGLSRHIQEQEQALFSSRRN
jgi:hypothetical protein